MEITLNYPKLKQIVNNHIFENGNQFEFETYLYNVFLMEHTKKDEEKGYEPIFWKGGSALGDFDIYLPEKVFGKRVINPIKKVMLFHEATECYFSTLIRGDSIKEISDTAHKLTGVHEARYIRETLNESSIRKLMQLKQILI